MSSQTRTEPRQELRPGTAVEFHAIVLGSVTLKESNRLVHLLTLEQGRISAIALGAAKSQKRFGASLDPMNHIKALLKVPSSQGESSYWRFERADLKANFPHLRTHYAGLESAFFVIRLVQDLIPEGPVDPSLFRAVGRFLRDSADIDFSVHAVWARVAFWTWFTHHLGFGDLSAGLEAKMAEVDARWPEAWHGYLASDEPDLRAFFAALAKSPLPALTPNDEIALYRRWVDLSGMHWDHFEQWVASKKF